MGSRGIVCIRPTRYLSDRAGGVTNNCSEWTNILSHDCPSTHHAPATKGHTGKDRGVHSNTHIILHNGGLALEEGIVHHGFLIIGERNHGRDEAPLPNGHVISDMDLRANAGTGSNMGAPSDIGHLPHATLIPQYHILMDAREPPHHRSLAHRDA